MSQLGLSVGSETVNGVRAALHGPRGETGALSGAVDPGGNGAETEPEYARVDIRVGAHLDIRRGIAGAYLLTG